MYEATNISGIYYININSVIFHVISSWTYFLQNLLQATVWFLQTNISEPLEYN